MRPNDLPLVCLPLDLPDEAAATLIEFLQELTEALERHYAGQLLRHAHACVPASAPPDLQNPQTEDPPF
jgi:hypothetical protein